MSGLGAIFYSHEAIRKAATITGFQVEDITGRCRVPVWKVLRDRGASLQQIGNHFGRDHATVLNGLKRADYLMRDEYFSGFVEALR